MRTHRKALLIVGSFAFGASLSLVLPTFVDEPTPCMEDEPCWDCATMGNNICGPVTADATEDFIIVNDGEGDPLVVLSWDQVR